MGMTSAYRIHISHPPIAKGCCIAISYVLAIVRSKLTAHTTFELSHHIYPALYSAYRTHSNHEMVLNSILMIEIMPPFLNCKVHYFHLVFL